ncbi:S-layer homology domain-containing protein [Cohnella cholangitidis]|uniref:S-layer homology domain-containing protein n=1 Tax=Cohnella cholangitidis TaxID=2598458 RepID=A0A7G5BV47_9BACL|nr:S-layer homology domain-containing protein [Cohnella cholangitidis]QMV40831.1 S-layer homology domain-containing protein [Cohnella cholangitidis]
MKLNPPILKKTAAATLALTMLVGGATGAMASAKNKHGNNDWKNSSWDDRKDNDKDDKKNNKSKVEINLDFGDLNEKEWKWAYDHIIRLAAQGVFNGYEDGSFKPRNNITRIEALVAAVRLLGLKEEAEKPENMNANLNFKDFDQLKKKYGWAVGYVTVALENDLFSETEVSIQADKPANRLWASVLLVKAMKLDAEAKQKMDAVLPFRDAKQIPAGSVGYIAVALEKNLITGYNDNTFQPNRPVTRAELAALLDRVDQQLPEDQNAQAITGSIQAIANGTLTVKKADNTTVQVPVDANVFIFRKDVKAPLSALQVGDEALVRTFQGKAVFIEVTKAAEANVQLADSGKVSSFTLNAQGKIATIALIKEVNGTINSIIYNVDPNVTITGNSGVLSPNLNVVVKGTNNLVQSIEILA